MKLSVLLALGLVGTNGRRHKHTQKHAKTVSNQVLQQEINELQENFKSLEKKYQQLSTNVHSFAQSPYGLAGPGGPAFPNPQPFVRGEKQWMDNG